MGDFQFELFYPQLSLGEMKNCQVLGKRKPETIEHEKISRLRSNDFLNEKMQMANTFNNENIYNHLYDY